MSVANIINRFGELEISHIATENVRLKSSTQEQNLSASIIKTLLDRIEALEQYVLAHQETYEILASDGSIVRLIKSSKPGLE